MGIFKKINKVVKKAGKQLSQNVSHMPEVATQIGQIGALPLNIAAGSIGAGLSAAAPVLGQATGILQANPLLGQALSAATGMPAGLFGGMPADAGGGGGAFGGTAAVPMPQQQPGGVPIWLWIVGGIAAALGLFLIIRKKA
jgi:hypothetical protein